MAPALKKIRHQPSSASILLPLEIMFQIFLLFPWKKLAQLSCVSKSWHFLINDPHFVSHHRSRHHHRRIITLSSPENQPCILQSVDFVASHGPLIKNLEFPTPMLWFPKGHVQVVGSCDGLILSILDNHLFLWNPTTKKSMKLPEVAPRRGNSEFYGLGFDRSTNDYKVVMRRRPKFFDDSEVQIYTRKTNSWETIQDIPYHFQQKRGIFVNGFLHWLGYDERGQKPKKEIVSFDLAEEKFQVVPPPEIQEPGNVIVLLGALEGLLCAVSYYLGNGPEVWTVWEMKEYGMKESWTKLMTIPGSPSMVMMEPLCYTENAQLIMRVGTGKIVKYDAITKEVEIVLDNDCESVSVVCSDSLDPPMAPKK